MKTANNFFSMAYKTASIAASLTLAYLLLRSAFPHLNNPYQFAQTVANYQIFSGVLVLILALVIPVSQVVVAFAILFVNQWRVVAAQVACLMSVVFLCAQIQAWMRGLDIGCGCFGATVSQKIGLSSMFQASALGMLGVICMMNREQISIVEGENGREM